MEAWIVFAVLAVAMVLFVTEWLRYDAVALLAMIAVTVTGSVSAEEAVAGFGHPAVITVAAVLVLSRGLDRAGVVATLAGWAGRLGRRPVPLLAALTGTVALASGFVNNIGALALMMPVALRVARDHDIAPSMLLMPMAFGSLVGGLTTLIGTPPNLIIASFRAEATGTPFSMFDFTPVGAGVALAAVAFICLVGWRLVPKRRTETGQGLFQIDAYLAEIQVPEGSDLAGKTIQSLAHASKADLVIAGVFRGDEKVLALRDQRLRPGDILVVEADTEALAQFLQDTGLRPVERATPGVEDLSSENVTLVEAVVPYGAVVANRSARGFDLRRRFGVNLLAIARRDLNLVKRVGAIRLRPGDVVLLQGPIGVTDETVLQLGLLPLAPREISLVPTRRRLLALGLFVAGIALAALGLLSAPVALLGAALAMILAGVVPATDAYDAVDLKLLVLLGAMIPVGTALEASGGAAMLADLTLLGGSTPLGVTAIVMVTTTLLSNVINNAAAAVLMAPVALGVAARIGGWEDALLMAVAVGASCAFLTPIGHQSNTLVMGPGGYRFGDYWRLGLPVQLLVGAVGLMLIWFFWATP